MRIIAGTLRGRRLINPSGGKQNLLIRPTADRAREALFNIIGQRVLEARVIDFFAGTGALGLEALSRGAATAVFVDNQASALKLIENNISHFGLFDRSLIIKWDLSKGLSFLRKIAPDKGFSLIFLDPPYGKGLALKTLYELAACAYLAKDALVIAEDNSKESLPSDVGILVLEDKRCYGDTGFWLYSIKEALLS